MPAITYVNADENRFWLQLLGDYARIIANGIPNDDANTIRQMDDTTARLDKMLDQARSDMATGEMMQFDKTVLVYLEEYRRLMLQILNMKLVGNYPLMLDSAFMNNAATFAEEYMFLLKSFIDKNEAKILLPVQQEQFWLPPVSGNCQAHCQQRGDL